MWEQTARKTIILVTLVAATVVTAAGPAVADPSSTTSTGTCLIISSDPVAVGINPDCRPVGTGLPCDWDDRFHVKAHHGINASATSRPELVPFNGLLPPAAAPQTMFAELPADPDTPTYLDASLPGLHADLGDSLAPPNAVLSPADATDALVLRRCQV